MEAGNSQQINPPKGPREGEGCYGLESFLHSHLKSCAKNPDHQTFVPVDQFNVYHLLHGCRDNNLVDLVHAMSDLTVRVSVKYVSERRPETVLGSDTPYPNYKNNGRNVMRAGTGWVWRVKKYAHKCDSSRTCKCQECLASPTPKTQFAEICIQTAAYVVYDDLEAAHTTCHLFFDKGDSPRDGSGVRALSGWSVVESGEVGDWCKMVHVTHDLDLADLLDKMTNRWGNLLEKVNNKYQRLKSGEQESSSPSEYLPDVWDKLTIIVSHPHGCSKQVSVGYCTNRDEGEDDRTEYRYTTATCPGSGGARVFVLGDTYIDKDIIHCGNCGGNTDLNFGTYCAHGAQ